MCLKVANFSCEVIWQLEEDCTEVPPTLPASQLDKEQGISTPAWFSGNMQELSIVIICTESASH